MTTLIRGEMTEWSKVADCKSVGIIPRWFEPNSSHIKLFRVKPIKKNVKLDKLNSIYTYRRFKITFSLFNVHLTDNILTDNSLPKINIDILSFSSIYNKILKYNIYNTDILKYNIYKFFNVNKVFRVLQHIVSLNFRRRNFFPSVQSKKFWIYMSLSLGILSKFFKKGGSFIRSKLLYMVATTFIRRTLLFSSIKNIILIVKKTPVYIREILASLNKVSIAPYKSPFNKSLFYEKKTEQYFKYTNFIYINSKPYTFMKIKKKGRIKRKIIKKLVKFNRITDF